MEKLIVLGTGHAAVTKCYNTCFAITNGTDHILVDAGGGNGILGVLEKAQIPYHKIHNAFVTHKHTDHLLGMVWIIRRIAMSILEEQYDGSFNIYCHPELIGNISAITAATLDKVITDFIGKRILLIPVADGQIKNLAGYDFTFFDIHSTKAKQFGFTVKLNNSKTLTCLGDEPYNPLCQKYVENSDWLLCEAFCLHRDREIYKPYEKHHSTVKDACELAQTLSIKNLVLWHTEDQTITHRKELYTAEGKEYYDGNLYVPDDLEELYL
ncbi:MBL fold metallo-hydrolase [Desulfosporosinus sp.]|uniref:MBL fold metallo-hydrolase n=1 Tax=Desulfosporosinus sp. TaxID=157907 RepID=UPI0025C0DC3D|nr:MBL fold metallo-hydrolase [Desulfosporosinus sp.]MBC2726782.1 MBL fold metallo-hydrolase [Desulfosporosinus sp.]